MVARTVRLDDDLDRRLTAYCEGAGAVKNRVVAIALRSWLAEGETPRLPVQPPEDGPAPQDGDCGRRG